MGFAPDITSDEAAFGFERVERLGLGVIATAHLGSGLRAVKIVEDGIVSYAICDDRFVVLYASARSLAELRMRFAIVGRRAS